MSNLENDIANQQKIVDKIRDDYARIGRNFTRQNNKLVKLIEQRPIPDDIGALLINDGSMVKYNAMKKRMYDIGLMISGCNTETNQYVIQIATTDDNLEKVISGLETVLPHIIEDSKGNKHLCILEHTCAEFGVFSAKVANGIFTLFKTVRFRVVKIGTYDSIESFVRGVHKYCPYESENISSDYDDL